MIVNLSGANQFIAANAGSPLYYRGFTIRETAGAAASVIIWDSTVTPAGTILEEINLVGLQTSHDLYDGKYAAVGIFVQVVSGAVQGSIDY